MGREVSPMINAWSLAASILDGTFDEDYPIVTKKETEHSDYYYDYNRNDPDRKNPFTDPKDRERAENVVNGDPELDKIERMGGFEWTPGSPWPPRDPEEDGLDYENDLYENSSGDDYIADVDDQRSHHFKTYDDGMSLQVTEKTEMDQDFYEPKRAHFYKYHEEEILKDIEEYVSRTYQGHYTGKSHEYRNVQTIDLMASKELAASFCQANILKYGSRYGNKDGKNKKDLLKVIHYAMLLLHFDGHYGTPSMPSGNFDQMP
tara:strand:+ start:22 stop:804 length:783 start_codon:yes stop_codon:yes gene_type:complete